MEYTILTPHAATMSLIMPNLVQTSLEQGIMTCTQH